ncbi:hypothetical protein [Kordiimonas laminariae]|uniref:hypothetical protein n=1 Tax=Kordiimonas laminariae TaxID=2917717 RepID=UPI001FF45508|nr:hypothetical protein [Kordiimonas laminariae]MCK0070691.1 hypothetical protein [Kordiimonas laminariae]
MRTNWTISFLGFAFLLSACAPKHAENTRYTNGFRWVDADHEIVCGAPINLSKLIQEKQNELKEYLISQGLEAATEGVALDRPGDIGLKSIEGVIYARFNFDNPTADAPFTLDGGFTVIMEPCRGKLISASLLVW